MSIIARFMRQSGVDFRNQRTNAIITGMKNSYNGDKVLQFYPDTDIQTGDVVTLIQTSENFYITDVQSMLWSKRVDHLNAVYETEAEHQHNERISASTVYNIQNANQSVIGNNAVGNFTFGFTDLEALIHAKASNEQDFAAFLAVLQNALETGQCPKGVMQRFSDLLAKHAWLTGPVAQLLLSHFFAK